MDKSSYIPKHKSDFQSVSKIQKAGLNAIKDVLPEIFEWLEDINWPVAQELVKVLAGFGESIIPYVTDLISNPDGLRECSIYYFMLPLLNHNQLLLLKEELIRVCYNPTTFEKEEGYDKVAKEYLIKIL